MARGSEPCYRGVNMAAVNIEDEPLVQLRAIAGTKKKSQGWFAEGRNSEENIMSRLALLATAVALTLGATPVLAQTFSGL